MDATAHLTIGGETIELNEDEVRLLWKSLEDNRQYFERTGEMSALYEKLGNVIPQAIGSSQGG